MASIALEYRPSVNVPWRVIAFDLDDTLYPETDFVRSGFREIATWCGENLDLEPDTTFQELLAIFERGVRGTIFNSWIEQHGLPHELIPQMVRVYRDHHPQIDPFPGVREMLSDLRKRFRIGLLSDGTLAVQERKLSALGIGDLFDAVVFSDRLGRDSWKPSSKPFEELVKLLNVGPKEAVYVGDNPAKDFVACRRLGMLSIWFRQSTGIYSELNPESEACSPDFVVESIDDIRALLKNGRLA